MQNGALLVLRGANHSRKTQVTHSNSRARTHLLNALSLNLMLHMQAITQHNFFEHLRTNTRAICFFYLINSIAISPHPIVACSRKRQPFCIAIVPSNLEVCDQFFTPVYVTVLPFHRVWQQQHQQQQQKQQQQRRQHHSTCVALEYNLFLASIHV